MSEVCASSIEGAQGECAACGRAKLEDVCEEYATLRATFLDSPAQVRPEMGTYEGFIGKLRQTRLYGGLSRDLRPRVAGEAHRGLRVGGRRRRRLGLVMRVMGSMASDGVPRLSAD